MIPNIARKTVSQNKKID